MKRKGLFGLKISQRIQPKTEKTHCLGILTFLLIGDEERHIHHLPWDKRRGQWHTFPQKSTHPVTVTIDCRLYNIHLESPRRQTSG